MLYNNVRVLPSAGGLLDGAVVSGCVATWAWAGPRWHGLAPTDPTVLLHFVVALILAFLLISGRMRLYAPWRTEGLRRELVALAECVLLSFGAATAAIQFLDEALSSAVLAGGLVLGLTVALALRVLTRLALRQLRRRGYDYRVWVLVGRNERTAALAEQILRNPHFGIRVAAIVDLADGSSEQAPAWPRLASGALAKIPTYRLDNARGLQDVISATVIDEVVITLPMRSAYDSVRDMLDICGAAGIPVKLHPNTFELAPAVHSLAYVGPIPMHTHVSGPSNYGQLLAKRLLDLVCAALGLLVLLPLLPLAAIAVKLGSPGPVFFRQTRVGLHGRWFKILKFRTMHVNAPDLRDALASASDRDGLAFKMRADPRITATGRWMRKYHIDELPQLWNVLLGEMSLVGPRPLPVKEAAGSEWWQRRRLSVMPGLTCIWQVEDDPAITFKQWMHMDMDYIDRWSLWLDLKIIFSTVATLARGRGW
jgi:exopolysaccharide biosynthesis polyprenyl glycosylphosphotransferase